jgi:hypothetical protein
MRHVTRSKTMRRISLDWWTVIAALAATAIVKAGILPNISW